jgi:hypothetical protein
MVTRQRAKSSVKGGQIELTVILPIQVVNQRLYARLVQMSDVTRRLPRFLAGHDRRRGDGTEGVDDDFTSDGLDGVDHYGDCSGVELFEGLVNSAGKSCKMRGGRRQVD